MRVFVIVDDQSQPIMALNGNASKHSVEEWCKARGWKHVIVPLKILKDGEIVE